MRKKIKAIALKLFVVGIGVGTLSSCGVSDPDSPGHEFMPDMYRSPAIEPYVDYGWIKERENKELTLQLSVMHPPSYTIKYHGDHEDLSLYFPYHRQVSKFAWKTHGLKVEHGWRLGETATGDYAASAADKNPIVLTEDNYKEILADGERLYDINCAHCHGEKGDGEGPMVQSGAYMGVPDYHNLIDMPDGQMFYSIYYGKGMMGAHAPLMTNEEIWKVVHHINELRFEDYGPGTAETDEEVEVSDSTDVASN